MLAAVACSGLAAHALEVSEYYLDRSGWTVHACSNAPVSGGEGEIGNMFDDNLSTYWHSDWVAGNPDGNTTQTHWFTIDLGSSQEFKGFDYWGRPSAENGRIKKGKIYVSDEPFDDFGDANSAEAIEAAANYYENADNVAVAEFTFDYESDATGVRECRFNAVTGRYVLVLTSETVGNYATGAEFKLVADKVANMTGREDIDRTNWTVTACSTIADGNSGNPEAMFDDDLTTYWHQNWQNDTNSSNFHWFVIDMGESQDVDGFQYWRRQNNANGQFLKGVVYVSDEEFTDFTSGNHNNVSNYCNNNTPVANFTFNYETNANGVRVCEFEQTQHGRYVLVVISDSGSDRNGKHACCAQFRLFKDTSADLKARWFEGIRDAKTLAEQYRNMAHMVSGGLPATDLPVNLTEATIDAVIATRNTQLQNFVNSFDRMQVLIKSKRRNQYLSAITNGNGVILNTLASTTPNSVWEIRKVNGGFRLYNRTTGFFIGTGNAAAAAGSAQTFVPNAINTNYVSFSKGGSVNLLNVNSAGSDLTNWHEANDEGSSWEVSLANSGNYNFAEYEASTAEAPKYYRLVNARWMYQANSSGTSLSVNGLTVDGGGVGELCRAKSANVSGNYWRVEEVDGGGVKLINLLGFGLNCPTNNVANVTDEGSVVYLSKQTDSQFNGINIYGISNNPELGNASFLDASNDGTVEFCWSPTRDNVGNNNNGSAWYFILAGEDEINAATETYVTTLSAQLPKPDSSLEAVFGSDFYNESILPHVYAGENTIAGLNAAKASGAYDPATVNEVVNAKVAELGNRHFLVHNKNANYSNCYLTVSDQNTTAPTADATDLNAVWSFVPQGEDNSFLMTSFGHGGSIYYTNGMSTAIPVQEEGLPYSIAYNAVVPGFSFRLIPTEDVTDVNYYALHQSDNGKVCKWVTGNIPGSHWMLEVLDDMTMSFEANGDNHTIMLGEGVTLNTHASAAAHQMVISKVTGSNDANSNPSDIEVFAVEPVNDVYTLTAADFADGVADITKLPEGMYNVEAPAGMFLVNGKPAAAVSRTMKVNSTGAVTGIDEVDADAAAKAPVEGIYDLQGRKLAAPVKGINIINGKKVLVK